MASSPIFVVAANKIERAREELQRLDLYLRDYDRSGLRNDWSRTSTIAFSVHNIYNGLEDVMGDLARAIDDHVPHGPKSHQDLLDQMHVALENRRPAFLDDVLYRDLAELKAFRHFVRHHYGVDLQAEKTDEKLALMRSVLPSFISAFTSLEEFMSAD